jgi:hypothetical protein
LPIHCPTSGCLSPRVKEEGYISEASSVASPIQRPPNDDPSPCTEEEGCIP